MNYQISDLVLKIALTLIGFVLANRMCFQIYCLDSYVKLELVDKNSLNGHPVSTSLFYFFIFNLFICLCIFWLRRVFIAARGLSLVAASRGYSSLQCVGFSLWWLLLLQGMGSRHVGFSSCGAQAQ